MLTALLLAFSVVVDATDPCAEQQPGRTMTARVVTMRHTPGDTLRATVCVVPARGASAGKIGSYHGELHYDSTAVSLVRVEQGEGGVRVENSTVRGQVNFAGAAPTGFPGRALVSVVLKLHRSTSHPSLRLRIKELNTTDGQTLLQDLVIDGAGTPAGAVRGSP